MAILRNLRYKAVSDWGSPFSPRPNSRLALAADPGDAAGRVQSLSMFFEVVAAGDVGALHRHPTDEAIYIEDGELEVRIGDRVEMIGPGDVAFVPRTVPHGWRNLGPSALRFRAVFASDLIGMERLARTPELDEKPDPQQIAWIDVRAALTRS